MKRKATDTQTGNEPKLPCAQKITFDTQRQAQATATTSQYWYGQRPHAYRCRYCGLWHLSTSTSVDD